VIVIDSSALTKYILREEGWREVRKYLEEGCVTLDLAIKETINALWKRVLMGNLDEGYAKEVVRSFLESGIVKVEEQDQLLEEAFSIAVKRKMMVYDSVFIALAKKKGLPLLTSDRKQAEVAEEEGVKTILTWLDVSVSMGEENELERSYFTLQRLKVLGRSQRITTT